MRKLSTTQKGLLKEFLKREVATDSLSNFYDWDDLPMDIRGKLVYLNDYETLWSDTQRFLVDEALKLSRKVRGVMFHIR